MKAMVCTGYGSSDVFQLQDVAKPVPKDHEVLVRIHATTVTPSDCLTRRGTPFAARLMSGLIKPGIKIMGVEFSGEVQEVGKDVVGFKPGDQVFGSAGTHYGAYAEYISLSKDSVMTLKPNGLTYMESACLCDGALTALNFLKDQASIQKGQKVLINGASGSVGSYAVQLAKYFGAHVTGVCSTTNVDFVRSLGADAVIDYTKEDFTCKNTAYDIIFDAIGKSSFSLCQKALKAKGVYMTTVPTPAILFHMLKTRKGKGKRAVFSATGLKKASDNQKGIDFLADLAASGKIKTIIDRSYPMVQLSDAQRYVEVGHKRGNVVITTHHEI